MLAQDEASSKFPAMPAAAVATTEVVHVLAVDEIPAAIQRHLHRSALPA